jgi:hypothetical protein
MTGAAVVGKTGNAEGQATHFTYYVLVCYVRYMELVCVFLCRFPYLFIVSQNNNQCGNPDPDPIVIGQDPDPSIIKEN